jgi:hypothetical protein
MSEIRIPVSDLIKHSNETHLETVERCAREQWNRQLQRAEADRRGDIQEPDYPRDSHWSIADHLGLSQAERFAVKQQVATQRMMASARLADVSNRSLGPETRRHVARQRKSVLARKERAQILANLGLQDDDSGGVCVGYSAGRP